MIIGFGSNDSQKKYIYDGISLKQVTHINPYLIEAPDIMIESRSKPLSPVLAIQKGCQPTDGGNLIIEDEDYSEFIKKEPKAIPYIKRLIGSREFINNKRRWCVWLVNISPGELRKMPLVMERVEKCRQMRLNSSDSATRSLADHPTQFRETINPKSCIVIPEVSSENRRYIPIGFIDDSVICTNKLQIIPDGTLYHFGILTSNVHMAWMRAVCGRLKSDYDYSQKIVYNNFPWPELSGEWEVGSILIRRKKMGKSYKELIVWQKTMEVAKNVYVLVKKLPKEETYALSDQMRRAAVSIPSNIAEGQGRASSREFSRFLSIARGSALEVDGRPNHVERLSIKVDRYSNCVGRISTKVDVHPNCLDRFLAKIDGCPSCAVRLSTKVDKCSGRAGQLSTKVDRHSNRTGRISTKVDVYPNYADRLSPKVDGHSNRTERISTKLIGCSDHLDRLSPKVVWHSNYSERLSTDIW